MTKNEVIRILRNELPRLRDEFGLRRIGLFGSFAHDEQTEPSDVDIVAEFERPVGLRFVEFSDHLERLLGRNVDVLTPTGVSSIRNRTIAQSIERSVLYV